MPEEPRPGHLVHEHRAAGQGNVDETVAGDRTALEEEPLYNALDAVKEDRLVFTDGTTAGAIYFDSVLSHPYILEQLVPALATTVAGDGPATTGET